MTNDLLVQVDRSASEPLYAQIRSQVIRAIEEGRLSRGARLPTVRDLAERLGVTRVTVHSAYSDLQARGWVEATVGRGTFVSGAPMPEDPRETVAGGGTPESALADMHRISNATGVLSLAMADPDPELLPAAEFLAELRSLSSDASSLFVYGSMRGDRLLRHELARRANAMGVECGADEILVTAGGTDALSTTVDALTAAGDTVLVEDPTYLGFLALLRNRDLQAVGVSLDEHGLEPEALDRVASRHDARLLYTIPSFQNPTGVTMPEPRRREILEVAARHDLTIIEDDVYRHLAFDGTVPQPLKALDGSGRVVYVDSFSKALLPGLRIGYAILPARLDQAIGRTFEINRLSGPQVLQQALAEFLRKGRFERHLREVVPSYRRRRDALLDALEREMPEGTSWTRPGGGLCCWVLLPEGTVTEELYWAALQRGVAYAPGEVFRSSPRSRPAIRLSFGRLSPRRIERAVAVLGELVAERVDGGISIPSAPSEQRPLV